ncbi:hypothetical protein PIB30_042424 [Stylosanthes scabra]|uniref:RING-CH-type domain-containing protein n=1 Tax=Stylosanthes scabra TaxID=79078 RepID=A0ABU6RFX0_9FABA|nr:hypothetical protein [Stylosanthes scabra]
MSMLVTEDDNNNNNNDKPHVVVDIDNNVSHGSGSSCVGNEGCASSETSEEQQQQSSSHDSGSEIVAGAIEKERGSSVSSDQCSVDLESDVDKVRHLDLDHNNNNKVERDCRICHLSMDMTNHESGGSPIELGCSCKDDLAAAHKHCAEAWFKIKGNNLLIDDAVDLSKDSLWSSTW